ncbi:MAG TPA: serine hydrolase, partial [Acidimicrobiales bacterium]|nr:serine hydrolase [Acidimicrobiales bacterium]
GLRAVLAGVAAVCLAVQVAAPAGAVAFPQGAAPKAWILVDASSGRVLDAGNDRAPLPPASLTKLLTALVAVQHLQPTDTLAVSPRAAGMPAMDINMKPGQQWTFQDALYSLLLVSANDAAVAIGERVGGSLEGFGTMMQQEAAALGLQDNPVLRDPAGLDDNFSVDGGNLLSARDIAIVARADLAQPLLASVVSTPIYRFVGPDGTQHRLLNHNKMLSAYPGAIGMKTGYTRKSGEDLVAAATRGDRTLIAVVMGAPNLYTDAGALLDEGFAGSAPPTGDVLPGAQTGATRPARIASAAVATPAALTPATGHRTGTHGGTALPTLWIAVGTVA